MCTLANFFLLQNFCKHCSSYCTMCVLIL
jgi:hypothetical protein